jgi:hypothetical protein
MSTALDELQTQYAVRESSGTGRIVEVTPEGEPLVDFAGNPGPPIKAKSIIQFDPPTVQQLVSRPVLLTFDCQDSSQPIILGLLHDRIIKDDSAEECEIVSKSSPTIAEIDGQVVKLTARKELTIRCGEASVMLRRDGKIILKGTQLLSRASGSHRIQGSSVAVN